MHHKNLENVENDPSARSPNRFFIEMRLGMKWLVATNDMKDAGGQNSLDAQLLRAINICWLECFARVDEAFEYGIGGREWGG